MTEHIADTAGTRAGIVCPECGHEVSAAAAFCGECGHHVAAHVADPPTEPLAATEILDEPPTEVPTAPPASWTQPAAAPGPAPPNGNGSPQPAAEAPPWTGQPQPAAEAPPQQPWAGQPQPGYPGQAGTWPPQPGFAMPPAPPPPVYPALAATGYPAPPERKSNTGLIVGLVAAGVAAAGLIVAVVLLATNSGGSSPTITTTATQAAANVKPVAPSAGTTLKTSSSTAKGSAGGLVNGAVKPKPKPTPAPAPSSGQSSSSGSSSGSSPPPPSANIADANGARAIVQEHWAKIGSGDYAGAWALETSSLGGSESDWVANHQKDAPQVLSAVFGPAQMNSSTDATVPIVSLKTQAATDGCKAWSGSYEVVKSGGQWLISGANISDSPC